MSSAKPCSATDALFMMFVLGLTGSIAMGKSTASGFFKAFGVPVFDADAAVHALFTTGGAAVTSVLDAFPGCGDGAGGVDRSRLGKEVFDNPAALKRLEYIVHPLVRDVQRRFLRHQAADRSPFVVMDIPLLYETGGDRLMDAVAVVSAPGFLQAQRVLRRPGMTEARLKAILERQVPDHVKRKCADFVIPTGLGKRTAITAIEAIIRDVRQRSGTVWPKGWRSSGKRP